MASRPKPSAKNETGEYAQFTNFMRQLVAVPHSEIKARLEAGKRAKVRKPKKASASRDSVSS